MLLSPPISGLHQCPQCQALTTQSIEDEFSFSLLTDQMGLGNTVPAYSLISLIIFDRGAKPLI